MHPSKNNFYVLLCLALVCSPSHAELSDRDQPIHLEAGQVNIDDAKQISTFEGAVQFTQGTITIRGDKIVVTQDKEGLKHGTATGQLASFRQKRQGLDEYIEGYGERIEYDSNNAAIDFFGQAHIKRGQDEVRGDHITYNSRTEIFQANSAPNQKAGSSKGRVRVIIQPKTKPDAVAPAATPVLIKPDPTLPPPGNAQ
ncbi:MAG: lipopolysaccharide transport periplasmic protein LptA [Gallionellaceae bacterium]|nr:lipopolysaccharide transport periplasmic protein LptA [Gallionellaceae bacterium]